MRGYRSALVAALMAGMASGLAGQTAGEGAAYTALLATPVGSLPPSLRNAGTDVTLRYGHYQPSGSSLGLHNFGLTSNFGGWLGDNMELTVGMKTCSGCQHTIMAGMGFYTELARRSALESDALAVKVGLRPDIGVGHQLNGRPWYWSASLGLPVSANLPASDNIRVTPFIQPGLAYGLITHVNDSRGGVRPMLGGGLGLHLSSGLGVNFGGQKVFLNGGTTQWGVGLSWRGSE